MTVPLPPVPLPDQVVALAGEYADGTRQPVEARDAATVILLRDGAGGGAGTGADGPEVYLLRRRTSMDFAGGACVFPGGGVDPRDFDASIAWAGPPPAEWATRLGVEEDLARALVCSAVRETFEESGVLLAGGSADTVVADTTGEEWEADRAALESHALAMTDFLTRRGLVLRTDLLGIWDGWLTPVFEPKRYRTWFFVARLPLGQRTRDVSSESAGVLWRSAGRAAEEAGAGTLRMMPPTYLTCLELAQHASADEVLAVGAGRSVEMFTPTVEPLGDGFALSMPDRLRPLVAARDA